MHPEFNGCLYIDDIQENLDAAKPFGFKTYRFAINEGQPVAELMNEILKE
jgi:methionine salvage enolase-phosphatase E1